MTIICSCCACMANCVIVHNGVMKRFTSTKKISVTTASVNVTRDEQTGTEASQMVKVDQKVSKPTNSDVKMQVTL